MRQVGVRITVISAGNPKIRNLGHGFIVDLVGLEARDKYVLTLSVRRKSKVNYQSMVSKQKARKTCSCPTDLNVPVDDRWFELVQVGESTGRRQSNPYALFPT